MAAEPSEQDYVIAGLMVAIGPLMLVSAIYVSKAWGPKRPRGTAALRPAESNGEGNADSPAKPRLLYLDAWRVLCVVIVVVAHGAENYAEWNVGMCNQWLLQVLLVISGTCFGFAKFSFTHAYAYCSRLVCIFSFGCAFNWAGAAAAGRDWWHDPMFTIGFQMSFVLLMAGSAFLCCPLKALLEKDSSRRALFCCCSFYGLLSAACAYLWSGGQPGASDATCTCSMLLLASIWVAATLPAGQCRRILGWGMLIWMFGAQVLFTGGKLGFWAHLIAVYCWALVVQRVPLLRAPEVGLAFLRTWPFVVFAGVLIGAFPGQPGRHEKNQFKDPIDRARWMVPEVLFLVAFVAIPTVGVEQSVPISKTLESHTNWLNWWSLLIFCCHKALYYVLAPIPWGLTINLGSCAVFMFVWKLTQRLRPKLPDYHPVGDTPGGLKPGEPPPPTVVGAEANY